MDEHKIQFSEYEFDKIPYTINVNVLEKKIRTKNCGDNGDPKDNRINLLINETLQECATISEKMRTVHTEISQMQMELHTLKQEEKRLSTTNFDLKEGS